MSVKVLIKDCFEIERFQSLIVDLVQIISIDKMFLRGIKFVSQ